MAGRKSDFTLTKLDDLFTTQAQREEEKLSKIRDIPLGLIDDFPDHPFKVRDDEDMLQLIESIRDRGVITPATVRQAVCLRHSHVSLLISKKYDIFEVSKRIGHKSVKTTQDIYGHLFDDVQKSIANDLNMIRRGGV